MEKIFLAQIKIYIEGYGITDLNYTYNSNTSFQDLLEYIAYLIPSANICQCSKFQYGDYNYYKNIQLDKKLYDFKKQFNKLSLFNKKKMRL